MISKNTFFWMRIKMGAQCCGLCPYELQILQCKDNIKAAASLNNNKNSLSRYFVNLIFAFSLESTSRSIKLNSCLKIWIAELNARWGKTCSMSIVQFRILSAFLCTIICQKLPISNYCIQFWLNDEKSKLNLVFLMI